jgi:hypothetical protein
MNLPWILIILVALIIIVLAVFFLVSKRKETKAPNYRTLFTIGIIWVPCGIAIKNYALAIIGLVFLIIGLVNKNKWQDEKRWTELTPIERRTKLAIVIIGGLLLIAGALLFFFMKK